ncbi:hypothetical protein PTTG_26418 [Puccinia triticina 1-1 BBBD Race 1]|uniref:Inositol-pentakisphosphate 2-kinase n=2 Tax=Puccinia triticina TaxID=208348 RepID=A0A180GW50_PUCT1|nr:uncharacterized protein PtA15_7A719 [Puccinia triticina]OAV96213.1 hypothetical protein PTTG_26418 [Puccinia triticina 1-1 BBBD Race 1]WAQ86990.1 hypothetical protein PtA15_7A719 [Puccinia triticina]
MVNSSTQHPANLPLSQAVAATQPTHWTYIAEGAANLILAYRPAPGSPAEESLRGKCLRLAKRIQAHPPAIATDQHPTQVSFFDFHHHILRALLPQEQLLRFDLVTLAVPQPWLDQLAAAVEPRRPPSKRGQSRIDCAAPLAVLMDNLARESDGDQQHTIAVEIKPKWAWLPHSPILLDPTTRETKSQFCRTCVFRAVRALGPDTAPLDPYYLSPARFCALQLFSTQHPAHLRSALDRLRAEWQHQIPSASLPTPPPDAATGPPKSTSSQSHNNFKIFRHGLLLDPSSVEVDPQLIEVLAATLERSGVLGRLADLQRRLDMFDIEGVFGEVTGSDPAGLGTLEAPITLAELVALVPLLSEPLSPTAMAERVARLLPRTKAVMYALSMTFKDCSIFVRLPVHHFPENPARLSPLPLAPTPPSSDDLVKIIDLDLKPIARLHKYFKADRASFSGFINLLRSAHSPPTTCLELCNNSASA